MRKQNITYPKPKHTTDLKRNRKKAALASRTNYNLFLQPRRPRGAFN